MINSFAPNTIKTPKGYKPPEAVMQAPSGFSCAWCSPDKVMGFLAVNRQ
jgi:hypothetical protein